MNLILIFIFTNVCVFHLLIFLIVAQIMGEEIEPAGAVSASPQDKIEEIQKDGDDGVDNLNEEVAEIDLEDKDDNQKETEGEEEEQRCPHLHQANPDKFKAKIFLDAKCMVFYC